MDKEKRRTAREEYDQRHPDMGIVCWKSRERMWIAKSKDAAADYNRSLFQLKLGSWPNRELQAAYTADPASFQWEVLKPLEYNEREADHEEDLELLYIMCLEEYPDAKKMRAGRR